MLITTVGRGSRSLVRGVGVGASTVINGRYSFGSIRGFRVGKGQVACLGFTRQNINLGEGGTLVQTSKSVYLFTSSSVMCRSSCTRIVRETFSRGPSTSIVVFGLERGRVGECMVSGGRGVKCLGCLECNATEITIELSDIGERKVCFGRYFNKKVRCYRKRSGLFVGTYLGGKLEVITIPRCVTALARRQRSA